jgi:LysR family transcriptional regulator, benzoate and cis,cis-muconate-responsive activator of ben and cat genes
MELRQLRHFAAVVSEGNFSRAAKALHLTQPALSRQVKSLEDELGVTLLKREANRVTLTYSGQDLFEETREILALVDKAVRRVQKHRRQKPIRVGYMYAFVATLLPCALSRFQKINDDMLPELFDLMPQEIVTRARSGKLDIAIMPKGMEAEVPSFQWTELKQLAPVLVMPKNHRLAKTKRISPDVLQKQRLYGFVPSACTSYAPRIKRILEPFGVKPILQNQTADSLGSLLAAIEADSGLAILSEAVVPILPGSLTFRRFAPKVQPMPVIVGLPAVQPNPHAEEFVALLLDAATRRNLKWR